MRLLGLSEALAGTRTLSEVSAAINDVAIHHLGAAFGGVAVIEPDRVTMRYLDLSPLPEKVQRTSRFPLASTRPTAAASGEDRLVVVEAVRDTTELDPFEASKEAIIVD